MFDVAEDRTDIEEFKRRVHPDDIARVWSNVAAALDPTNPKPYADEFRHRRGDGEVRWTEGHTRIHFEGVGHERRAVRMVGTAQDITERKEREEQVQLLMREVNHRARNMLSVVNAIANQTVADGGRFSERIGALAVYQELLVRSEWKGVEIEGLARAQLSHLPPSLVLVSPYKRPNCA
jgi:hypothetical protein